MYVGLRLDYLPWLFILWLLVCYFQVKVESEVLVFVRKGWGRWVGELGENQLGKDKLSTKNSIHLYHTSGQEIALWAQRCEVPVRVLTTGPKAVTQINCELLLFFFLPLFSVLQQYGTCGGRHSSFYKDQWLNVLSSLCASESHSRGGSTGTLVEFRGRARPMGFISVYLLCSKILARTGLHTTSQYELSEICLS